MTINPTAYKSILSDHYLRYPKMQLADLYKLIHQGAMGSEHAVIDLNKALQWMEQEIASLLPGPPDPMIDPISENGDIVRVHLRPYLAQDGDPHQLAEAFVKTASLHTPSTENLNYYWRCAREIAEKGEFSFTHTTLDSFFSRMNIKGFPLMHHSDIYRQTYQPAYRVVLRELIN